MGSYVPVKEMSQWLHISVGRASHQCREVTGSNPVEVQNFFFQASLLNCIDTFTATIISSFPFHFRSSYMIYFIYH